MVAAVAKKPSSGSSKGTAGSGKGKKKGPPVGSGGRRADGKKNRSASELAQLSLPVSRIGKIIRKGRYAKGVSKLYIVKLTGIVEFVTIELLTCAMEKARARGRKRVTPRDFMLAVKDDEEFSLLLKNVQIADSGVAPKIHDVLMPRKKTLPAKKGKKVAEHYEDQEDDDEEEDGDEDDMPPRGKGREVSQDY